GEWVVHVNQYGRWLALVVFGVLGVTLLVPALADVFARPFVKAGATMQRREHDRTSTGSSMILGISAGLLWTPCAGPILGLILASVAVEGTRASSALMLAAFGLGAATALALALAAGSRVLSWMKRSLGVEAWVRRGIGVAVLAGVAGIALGWDTGILA